MVRVPISSNQILLSNNSCHNHNYDFDPRRGKKIKKTSYSLSYMFGVLLLFSSLFSLLFLFYSTTTRISTSLCSINKASEKMISTSSRQLPSSSSLCWINQLYLQQKKFRNVARYKDACDDNNSDDNNDDDHIFYSLFNPEHQQYSQLDLATVLLPKYSPPNFSNLSKIT